MRPRARWLHGLGIALSLLVATACGEPPNKEIDQAQGAIDAARAAGAQEYAAEEYDAAVKALERSRAAVEQRDYRQALSHALDARERAQGAARAGANEKARVRAETDRVLHVAELALDATITRLKDAQNARVPPRTLTGPSRIVRDAEAAIRRARDAMERDTYVEARTAIDGVSQRLTAAASEIDAAIAARAARRPGRRSTR